MIGSPGRVEVDESYVGGLEEGLPGRQTEESTDSGCCSRRWTGDWPDSHAPRLWTLRRRA